MGFLKDPLPPERKPRRKRIKHDVVSRAQQALSMIEGTSLKSVDIVTAKFTIRIKKEA